MDDTKAALAAQSLTDLNAQLCHYLGVLPTQLNDRLDARLVRSFFCLFNALATHRHVSLTLTDLADAAFSQLRIPAGVKRLSNLLRSPDWSAELLHDALWRRAQHLAFEAESLGQPLLMIWDESVWEKPETLKDPCLGSVRSAKAKRLNRLRPGFWHPHHANTHVAGLRWEMFVLATPTTSHIAASQMWSNRASDQPPVQERRRLMLAKCMGQFGRRVLHVFDRGYVGWPWLSTLLEHQARFLIRWKGKGVHLSQNGVPRDVYRLFAGKKSQASLQWRDNDNVEHSSTIRFMPVVHPEAPHQQLWCVMSKMPNHKAMYLLTNDPVESVEQARQVVLAYMRRWEIERRFQQLKSVMRVESIQLRQSQGREKLLAMVMLASNMLLYLMQKRELTQRLLREWNHRTGSKLRRVKVPFARMTTALDRLFCSFPEDKWAIPINSG